MVWRPVLPTRMTMPRCPPRSSSGWIPRSAWNCQIPRFASVVVELTRVTTHLDIGDRQSAIRKSLSFHLPDARMADARLWISAATGFSLWGRAGNALPHEVDGALHRDQTRAERERHDHCG